MNVVVSGSYGLQSGQIYCGDLDCNIQCLDTSSCSGTQIYISDDSYNDLGLQCSSSDSTSCSSAVLNCLDTGYSTTMSYDSDDTSWSCGTFGCCPLYDGNITCSSGTDCEVFIHNVYP